MIVDGKLLMWAFDAVKRALSDLGLEPYSEEFAHLRRALQRTLAAMVVKSNYTREAAEFEMRSGLGLPR